MPINYLEKSCRVDEVDVQDNEVSLVTEDRRFALILRAAQTQQSKIQSHVASPLRAPDAGNYFRCRLVRKRLRLFGLFPYYTRFTAKAINW
jgi:hypothetical protein